MKYFSVNYIPQKDDVIKRGFLPSLLALEKGDAMKIISVIFLVAFAFYLKQYELAVYSLIAFLAIPKISKSIFFSSQKKMSESDLMKRPVTVDFYGDHIVYIYNPTEKYKGVFERHFGFDKVTNVVDYRKFIAFIFKDNTSIFIPKRALDISQIEMIYNLITNLFSDRFIKADI